MVRAHRVAVGNVAPARLDALPEADYRPGHRVVLANRGASSVFLGGSDVTAATGWELPAGAQLDAGDLTGEPLYAVCAAAAASTCHVLQVGV